MDENLKNFPPHKYIYQNINNFTVPPSAVNDLDDEHDSTQLPVETQIKKLYGFEDGRRDLNNTDLKKDFKTDDIYLIVEVIYYDEDNPHNLSGKIDENMISPEANFVLTEENDLEFNLKNLKHRVSLKESIVIVKEDSNNNLEFNYKFKRTEIKSKYILDTQNKWISYLPIFYYAYNNISKPIGDIIRNKQIIIYKLKDENHFKKEMNNYFNIDNYHIGLIDKEEKRIAIRNLKDLNRYIHFLYTGKLTGGRKKYKNLHSANKKKRHNKTKKQKRHSRNK
jgi:hypothetical protein